MFLLSLGEWRGERRMLDITRDKPVKVCVRVVVPVRDHPKVSFISQDIKVLFC